MRECGRGLEKAVGEKKKGESNNLFKMCKINNMVEFSSESNQPWGFLCWEILITALILLLKSYYCYGSLYLHLSGFTLHR